MILSHFTNKKFIFNPQQEYHLTFNYDKPHGLWLSNEQDLGWRQWCRTQNWNKTNLRCHAKFKCDLTNWLVLASTEELLAFTQKYQLCENDTSRLNWIQVQQDYQGILISPYQWACRLNKKCRWYYGWDCASACVWDLSTITQVPSRTRLAL